MATHKKRDLGSSSCSTITSDSNDDCPKKRKRQITVTTFNKWQGQYNSLHKSLLWLRCDKDRTDRRLVSALWCCICRKYEKHITGLKNFSKAWIDGTDNQRTSIGQKILMTCHYGMLTCQNGLSLFNNYIAH